MEAESLIRKLLRNPGERWYGLDQVEVVEGPY